MVFAPAEMGEVGITPKHTPLVTRLKPGDVRAQISETETKTFFISGGLLEIQPNVVTVLSDTAIPESMAANPIRVLEEPVVTPPALFPTATF